MFRRKTVLTQGLCEEKSVYDSFNKLIAAQMRGSLLYTVIVQKCNQSAFRAAAIDFAYEYYVV